MTTNSERQVVSEYAGYQIEHVPTYYIADNGELRPYENHGLPGDELLCKYNEVSALLSQVERMRIALARYGYHETGCETESDKPCTCGFDAAQGASRGTV